MPVTSNRRQKMSSRAVAGLANTPGIERYFGKYALSNNIILICIILPHLRKLMAASNLIHLKNRTPIKRQIDTIWQISQ